MPRQLRLRELTEDEKRAIARIVSSRTEPVRRVQRARIIQAMVDDPRLPAAGAGKRAGYGSVQAGRYWVKRFNAQGLAGLEDEPRSGRPRVHSEKVRSALIDLAMTKPDSLGYPFKLWTLEPLQTAFKERTGVHLSDSTIWTWLDAEGLKWKHQQSWFHEAEKRDPEVVEKRGASFRPTSLRPPGDGSSVLMNWDHWRSRPILATSGMSDLDARPMSRIMDAGARSGYTAPSNRLRVRRRS